MPKLGWKVGFEIELLAPRGLSRRDLANEVASGRAGAKVAPAFLPQAEFSLVEDAPIFENLTLAYDALDKDGSLIARFADDLTLINGLDRDAAPKPGWYRIIGDDARFLRLIMHHSDPGATLDKVLEPAAKLFGVELQHLENDVVRLADSYDAPIVMAATLPGERERPCEIITPPIEEDHATRLAELLGPARELEFTIPSEAALHIHFDATDLCNAKAFANLVHLFGTYGDALKKLVGTNPNCRRLGGWPEILHQLVSHPEFIGLTWEEIREELEEIKLTKFVDFNLANMVHARADKHTFEVRILPVILEVEPIMQAASLFEAMLRYAVDQPLIKPEQLPGSLSELIEKLPLDDAVKQHWLDIS